MKDELTISGWVCRNNSGKLLFFPSVAPPTKCSYHGWRAGYDGSHEVDFTGVPFKKFHISDKEQREMFANIVGASKPQKATITIKLEEEE